MKYLLIISMVFIALSCKPAAPKMEDSTAAVTSTIVAPKDSIIENKSTIPCDAKGKLIEKFEQNNALFERFSDEAKELEWLKITTKDGKCTILDDVGRANHSSVSFEDWDKDGFKDRVNNWKWDYEVCLFDKTKNDFSRLINGRFNGDQWDFDKNQNLKYQFLENKFGGTYELYTIKDAKKTVFSDISFSNAGMENDNDSKIEIRKNIVYSGDAVTFDTLKVDAQFYADTRPKTDEEYEAQLERTKKVVAAYWRKNLALVLKK